MKKTLAMLAAAAMMLTSLTACGGSDDSAASGAASGSAAASGDVLVMSTNATFPPYEYYDENQEIVGIDAEIGAAIAEKLGMELEIADMDFDPAITAAQTGQSDFVMAGLTVTPEREENLNFSTSYAKGIQVVIVAEDGPVQSLDDMEGKLIGVQQGTTGDIYCSDSPENGGFGEDAVVKYASAPIAIEALKNGQVDCVVIDNEPAKNYVAANEGLKILDMEFANEDYAIGIAKDNTELLDAVNQALAELDEEGVLDEIIGKYIPAE